MNAFLKITDNFNKIDPGVLGMFLLMLLPIIVFYIKENIKLFMIGSFSILTVITIIFYEVFNINYYYINLIYYYILTIVSFIIGMKTIVRKDNDKQLDKKEISERKRMFCSFVLTLNMIIGLVIVLIIYLMIKF